MSNKKYWARANRYGNAEVVEWKRYIEDPKLIKEIKEIQSDLSLPLSIENMPIFFEDPLYSDWMGWNETDIRKQRSKDNRRKKLAQIINKLMAKHQIPPHYFGSLFLYMVIGKAAPSYQSKGFPTFVYGCHEDRNWKHECIITPVTDLGNPLVLDTIKKWQEHHKGKPPLPLIKGRVKDWRPVWEWRNRNPDISDREIAEMLHFNRVTVSRALEKLDKEYATK